MPIYKILTATQWAAPERDGGTAAAPAGPDGKFVHFPDGAQVFPEGVEK